MRRVLKWIGIVIGGLIGVILIAAVVLYVKGSLALNQSVSVPTDHIDVPTDAESLARGKEFVTIFCAECHGEDLGGQVMLADPMIGTIYSANLTTGQGGAQATFSDDDLVRAIRHGVDPEGHALIIMPSAAFNYLSAEDLGSIIAYLKTLPPVDHVVPEPSLTLVGHVMLGAGVFGEGIFPANVIDHSNPFPPMPEIGANAAYGEYFTRFCRECHGPDLTGGPSTQPGAPPAPNLTMTGELSGWSETDFLRAIKTGMKPSGHMIDAEFMPVEAFSKLPEDELKGIYMYLHSIPADQ
jgi:mono/diheme cytochrome c family protein